jgi:hypothetical protein
MNITDHLPAFFAHYLATALWSSTDAGGNPLDAKYTEDDIEAETLEILKAHCLSFLSRAAPFIDAEDGIADRWTRAGHDFWLTSQGHGAGFWDGDWPKYGDLLTKMSKCYPSEINLEQNEGGQLVA